MKRNDLSATDKLLRFDLRQNKMILTLILFLPFLLAFGTASSNIKLLADPLALRQYINESISNPVSVGMLGPILSNTIAGVTAWRIRISSDLFAAIFSIVVMIKHTRKDEESGRLELIRAGVVGRRAPLTAALIKAISANIMGGLLMAAGFTASGFPAGGSLAAGLATGLCGCFFAAVAGVAAQVTPNARTAYGISYGLLAFFLFFNVIGNFQKSPGGVFYLSPFSWGLIARPFAGDHFWVLVFAAVLILLMIYIAYFLLSKRDMGAGLISEKGGRAAAKPGFNNTFALAWRLQRGMAFSWAAGYAAAGALAGSLVVTIESMFSQSSAASGWLAGLGGSGKAFLYFLIYILAEVASAYAIMAALRIRTEESEMRVEPILTTSVSREKWALSHLLFTFAGSAVIVAAMGTGAGITASASIHNGSELWTVLSTCLAKIPAVWFVASITVFLIGFLPKLAAGISWTLLGIFFVIEFLWELKVIGNAVFRLSPFSYFYPTNGITAAPVIALTFLAAFLTIAGIGGLKHRQIGV